MKRLKIYYKILEVTTGAFPTKEIRIRPLPIKTHRY
jgi:hypothetical protein